MKIPKIANAVGQIDDDLISGAAGCGEKKHWARWGSLAACLAVLIITAAAIRPLLLGGGAEDPAGTDAPHQQTHLHVDRITLSVEQAMSQATHIMSAEYLGTYVTQYGTELMFAPADVMKGTLDTADSQVLYVVPGTDETSLAYTEGEKYLLILEKHISVYYEHNKYVRLGELMVSESDSTWAEYCDQATQFADNGAPEEYGNLYTDAKALGEIIDFSSNIFVIRVDSVLQEGVFGPITAYRCTVTGTVKNTPAENGNILITVFNGTVEVGGEYLVLLADATESVPIYTLAAREGCVHALETAASVSELKALLEQVTPYSASEN